MPATKNNKDQLTEDRSDNAKIQPAPETKEEQKVSKEQVLEQFKNQIAGLHNKIAQQEKTIASLRSYVDSLLQERAELGRSLANTMSSLKLAAATAETAANSVAGGLADEFRQYHQAIEQEKMRNENNR